MLSSLLNASEYSSLLSNVPSAFYLPPEKNLPARLASLTAEESMSTLLHQSSVSVHGISGSAADLHIAQCGVC
jgi:hypothetical protein